MGSGSKTDVVRCRALLDVLMGAVGRLEPAFFERRLRIS